MMDSADLSDIKSVLDGQIDVFRNLVERHQQNIYKLSRSILKDPFEAEEASHETFIKAYEKLAQFRREAGFSTWLYRICYHICLSKIRKARRRPDPVKMDENVMNIQQLENSYESMEMQDRKMFVQKALRSLPEDEQHILVLFYFLDLKVKEIGKITHTSESNVKIILYRGRKKILAALQKLLKKEMRELL